MLYQGYDHEESLLEHVAKGNEHAFRKLFDSYHNQVYGYAFRFLKSRDQAEEVVQEIFLKIWIGRENLVEIRNFGGYIRVLTNHHTLDLLRKKAVEFRAQNGKLKQWTDVDLQTMEEIILRNSGDYMKLAIDRLPKQQKAVYQMYYQDGVKHADIAQQLNISPLTVKVHLREAIKTLKTYLNEGGSLPAITFIFLGLIK